MAKFPEAVVVEAIMATVRIESEMPTVAHLTVRTERHQFVFSLPRADAERLARQIQEQASAAPISAQLQ